MACSSPPSRSSHGGSAACIPQTSASSCPPALADAVFLPAAATPIQDVIDGRPWLLAPSPTAILKRRDDRMYALPVILPGNLRRYATAPQLPADAIPRLYFKASPGEYRLVHLQPGA